MTVHSVRKQKKVKMGVWWGALRVCRTRDKPELSFGALVFTRYPRTLPQYQLLRDRMQYHSDSPSLTPSSRRSVGLPETLNDYVSWNVGPLKNHQYSIILKLNYIKKVDCRLGFWLFTFDTWTKEADKTMEKRHTGNWDVNSGPDQWVLTSFNYSIF